MDLKVKIFLNFFCLVFLNYNIYAQIKDNQTKVFAYNLPEMLISNNGRKIQTSEEWINIRRPEIIAHFETSVYGKVSKEYFKIQFVTAKTDSKALCGKAMQKNIIISFIKGQDTIQMELLVYVPVNSAKPVPLFVGMNFYGNHTIHVDPNIPLTKNYISNRPEYNIFNNTATNESRGVGSCRWPLERILERGYGLATIYYGDIDPDFDDGFKNGIHSLMNNSEKYGQNSMSSISAWAFGLSTAMDYFETDDDINQSQIVVIGHSRLGKTALWAGAIDQRFAIVISNNSGCGGAALSRRKYGETVRKINTGFPHWFCKNFHQFNDKENELPVDQHMLIGLIAPRPVYIGSAVQDQWADPNGEFLSLYHSGPVYELFGLKTIKSDTLPNINKPLWTGNLGYHIRSGKHDITRFDWEKYLDFADYHFNQKN